MMSSSFLYLIPIKELVKICLCWEKFLDLPLMRSDGHNSPILSVLTSLVLSKVQEILEEWKQAKMFRKHDILNPNLDHHRHGFDYRYEFQRESIIILSVFAGDLGDGMTRIICSDGS